MGMSCGTCHPAAVTSTKAQDDLLPSKQICNQCHDTSAVPQRPPALPVPVVHFNHAVHLKMGNLAPLLAKAIDKGNYLQPSGDVRKHLSTTNACEACHRGLEQSDEVTAAALPKMADCLVCHVSKNVSSVWLAGLSAADLTWQSSQLHGTWIFTLTPKGPSGPSGQLAPCVTAGNSPVWAAIRVPATCSRCC